MNVTLLGEARFASPIQRTVRDDLRVPENIVRDPQVTAATSELLFEFAGPREKLFFDPKQTRAGIVTCGGLCPGLNDIIRSLFFVLHHTYGVKEVIGFRGGYQGLDPARAAEPVVLTPAFVDTIHQQGGTVLGTSRGPVDTCIAARKADEVPRALAKWQGVVDGVVLRAITGDDTLAENLALVRAARPV